MYIIHVLTSEICQAIEEVEKEVERLLEVDATAEDVQYGTVKLLSIMHKLSLIFFLKKTEVVDNRDLEMENESDAGTQDQDVDIDDSDDESESDEDLAAAIDRDLEQMEEEDNDDKSEEDDDEDEDEDESEDEEDEEDGAQTGEIGQY